MPFGASGARSRMLEEPESVAVVGESLEAGMAVPKNKLCVGVPLAGSPTAPSMWAATDTSLWSDSSFRSVVDSSGCSTEAESSEDDDFMAGLAEQMAHSMLDDSDDNNGSSGNEVDSVESWGSPVQQQQQLNKVAEADQLFYGKSSWSTGCWNSGYSSSSSKVSSQVSSPPSTPSAVDDGWDLLHAVAGEVGRINVEEKGIGGAWSSYHGAVGSHHVSDVQWKHAGFHDSTLNRNGAAGSLPILTKPYAAAVNPQKGWNQREDDRKPPTQGRTPKQPPVGAWNRQARCQPQQQQQQPCIGGAPRSTYRCGVAQRPLAQQWQSLPPANGSVMRAVFLGGASDRASCGTGVFLPRSSSDYTKRKTSCSSVLLPSRIVQVLNLNIEDMRCQPSVPSGVSVPGNGPPLPVLGATEDGGAFNCPAEETWPSSQWKTYTTTCSQLHQPSEPTLPTEWSY